MYEVCLRTVRNQDKSTYGFINIMCHNTKNKPQTPPPRPAAGARRDPTPSGPPHGTDDKGHTRRGIRKVSVMQRQQEG